MQNYTEVPDTAQKARKKMQIVRSPWTGKMKIDKRKEETSGMMGANLAWCLLFLTPRDRGLQVKKLDEKFRHGKYPK